MNESLPILRASAMHEAGLDATTLRRRSRTQGVGRLVRVGPNAFVDGAAWDAAGPRQRYVTRVFARLGRLGTRATASHLSAAALHGLPALGGWDVPVHATVPESMYRGRSAELVLHTRPVGRGERATVGAVAVTSVPRTVVDVAMTGDLRAGVVIADAVLRRGFDDADLRRAVPPKARARALAQQVLDLADARSGSPAESLARVVFRELGLPDPLLQQEFVVDGRRSAVDFWFPDHGVIVEIDGPSTPRSATWAAGVRPRCSSTRSAGTVVCSPCRVCGRSSGSSGETCSTSMRWRCDSGRRGSRAPSDRSGALGSVRGDRPTPHGMTVRHRTG
ncbi:hypothetical protein NYS55_13680 [Curtobacterium flaccumfaciens pv. flaccumfaciens]|uniref:hypothetical protein n=1 Tax=Curtobacterium flaccumfaciens TaxID=2035 RepID=UPI00217D4CB5|nr:hypothetical protein [Curtobacterium flaccumfaciens]MCS6552475.1 hypothetical protein [Curtobacterium flaccumfaciens pv. flaccumfaciens]